MRNCNPSKSDGSLHVSSTQHATRDRTRPLTCERGSCCTALASTLSSTPEPCLSCMLTSASSRGAAGLWIIGVAADAGYAAADALNDTLIDGAVAACTW